MIQIFNEKTITIYTRNLLSKEVSNLLGKTIKIAQDKIRTTAQNLRENNHEKKRKAWTDLSFRIHTTDEIRCKIRLSRHAEIILPLFTL